VIPPAGRTTKAPLSVLPAAPPQQTHCNPQTKMPSPGGPISGMASYENASGWARGGCGIPSTSLEGYHTATRGQSLITQVPVSSRAAPGLPCGRAMPDRRDAPRVPACKIVVGDPGVTTSLIEVDDSELLTQNQMLGSRQPAG
jgi:hypothetical protein